MSSEDVSAAARAIVLQYKEPITSYHSEVQGKIRVVHHLFNHIAMTNGKSPFTPPAVAMLMGITTDQLKNASEEGPVITVDQLMDAFAKLVPPGDTAEVFEQKVVVHIQAELRRLRHAKNVMPQLKPMLTELHKLVSYFSMSDVRGRNLEAPDLADAEKGRTWIALLRVARGCQVEGDTRRLYEWFLELVPESSRPEVPIEAFSGMIMQTDPKETKIDLENFLEGVENNIETKDSSDKLVGSIQKHLAR